MINSFDIGYLPGNMERVGQKEMEPRRVRLAVSLGRETVKTRYKSRWPGDGATTASNAAGREPLLVPRRARYAPLSRSLHRLPNQFL
jgi:hypothetical protein